MRIAGRRNKYRIVLPALVIIMNLALLLCEGALVRATENSESAGAVSVVNAWSRATGPGMSVGVAYFEIVNMGAADTLLSIETPSADHVSIHVTSMRGGMMQMREIGSVEVPADGRVAFAPNGRHAMLMGLKAPLRVGEKIPLTLVFKRSGRVRVDAAVRGTDASPASAVVTPIALPAFHLAVWPSTAPSPDFSLIDEKGRLRTLGDYRGKVVAVVFGFMHCPDVCPTELLKLSLAVKHLGTTGKLVKVLFITLDPLRDTATSLNSYVTYFDPGFEGLTGSVTQVDRVAANFHVQYARVAVGDGYTIDHSTAVYVFDKKGKLRLIGAFSRNEDDFEQDFKVLAMQQ